MRENYATILNFTCKFGDKNLLDYWDTIVSSALMAGRERTYGKTKYKIIDTALEIITTQFGREPVVSGRYVKDTILSSEQILTEDDQLVESKQNIQSSPSAQFALFLRDHRLGFYAETKHAPDYKNFESTVEIFLRRAWKEFIDYEYERLVALGSPLTKTKLMEIHPRPELRINPISSRRNIANLVDKYETLKLISFKLQKSNPEFDPEDLFDQIQKQIADDTNGEAKLEVRNAEGLDKEAAKRVIEGGLDKGVHQIKTSGSDFEGNKLTATDDDLKVERELNVHPAPNSFARKVPELFGSEFRKENINLNEEAMIAEIIDQNE